MEQRDVFVCFHDPFLPPSEKLKGEGGAFWSFAAIMSTHSTYLIQSVHVHDQDHRIRRKSFPNFVDNENLDKFQAVIGFGQPCVVLARAIVEVKAIEDRRWQGVGARGRRCCMSLLRAGGGRHPRWPMHGHGGHAWPWRPR